MPDSPDLTPSTRTFGRAEVDAILLEAARLDEARGSQPRSAALARVAGDALTLADIERAAAEVGISRGAVSAASLRVALQTAGDSHRTHLVHEIGGTLTRDAMERVADDVRTHLGAARVRTTADGLEIEMGKGDGQPGSLLVKLRSTERGTTLSLWSAAPSLSGTELVTLAALGAPATIFPVVASLGGHWPEIASALGLAAGGWAAGAFVVFGGNRWRMRRWQAQVADAVSTIAASVDANVIAPPTP